MNTSHEPGQTSTKIESVPSSNGPSPPDQSTDWSLFQLTTIIRENHGHPINDVSFNTFPSYPSRNLEEENVPSASNLVATVGGPQANIYDTENFGTHMDLLSQFSLDAAQEASRARYARGVDTDKFLTTCCWIPTPEDALLAAAGTDGVIRILSVARSAEMAPLVGHTAPITHLSLHPTHRTLLISVSRDDTLRIWDLSKRSCLVIIYARLATVAAFSPDGSRVVWGTSRGELHLADVPKLDTAEETAAVSDNTQRRPIHHNDSTPFGALSKPYKASIEGIAYPKPALLVTLFSDAILAIWNPETSTLIYTITLPYTSPHSTHLFVTSGPAPHILLGSPTGSILAYAPTSSLLVAELSHPRCVKPLRCCTVSGDGRSIVAASEEGVIFRWELVNSVQERLGQQGAGGV